MKKFEMILIIGAIIGLLLALFNTPLDSLIVSVFLITLSCLYFTLGFALFNNIPLRKIFNADSYKGLGYWQILIAIGTGIAMSILTIGFMFSILSYPMAKTLLTVRNCFRGNNNGSSLDKKCSGEESVLQEHHLKEPRISDYCSYISSVAGTFI